MMLDVDLAIRTDLRSALKGVLSKAEEEGEEGQLAREMRSGMGALVVPAFEYRDTKREPEDWKEFPADKQVSCAVVDVPKVV